jgi:glycosyltransferase involved in cell wall biosynthesis
VILVSHPTVNSFVRALVEALHREGMLGEFHTTLALGRRKVNVPAGLVRSHPWREAVRLLAGRMGIASLVRHEAGWASVDQVYLSLDRQVARALPAIATAPSAIYAYEDGALETFQAAKRLGIRRVYDLPIAYWERSRQLLSEEAERLPQWEPTLFATRDSAAKLERKTRELAMADLVVCPSRFVQESLPGGTPSLVAEFGSPPLSPLCPLGPLREGDRLLEEGKRPLRILFAGSMTQRKGLADLFEAMKSLAPSHAELIVMGAPLAPMSFYLQHYPKFRHEKPRAHSEVLALMQSCDVLALPSIVEGRALVQQEALSCGLPLIVTANAGGEELIEEGETGFLVPIRSPQSIARKIQWFLDHRDALPRMRRAAQAMAARFTWEAYSQKIISRLR